MAEINRQELNGIYKLDISSTNLDPSFKLNFVKTDEDGLKMGAERVNPDKGCHISQVQAEMTMIRVNDNKRMKVSKVDKVKWYIWLQEI